MLKLLEIILKKKKKRRYARRKQSRWHRKRTPSSPPLMNTPKSQWSAEQPLMKKSGTYQKRYFTTKDKRTTMKSVGVADSWYNQISYPQVNDPQEEQLYCRGSPTEKSYGPHVKFPGELEIPGEWNSRAYWRSAGLNCRSSTGGEGGKNLHS